MDEYISREAAMEIVKHTSGDYASAFAELRKLPAADVAPVRHGRWKGFSHSKWYGFDSLGEPIYRDGVLYCCSECNRRSIIQTKYCPNCGAVMDGDKNG